MPYVFFSRHVSLVLRQRCSFLSTKSSLRSVSYGQVPSAKELVEHHVFEGHNLYTFVQSMGQETAIRHPFLHFPLRRQFAFQRKLRIFYAKEKANELDETVENSNSVNLHSKPVCHAVSKMFRHPKVTHPYHVIVDM